MTSRLAYPLIPFTFLKCYTKTSVPAAPQHVHWQLYLLLFLFQVFGVTAAADDDDDGSWSFYH